MNETQHGSSEDGLSLFNCTIEDFGLIPKRRCPNKTKFRKGSPEQKYLQNKEALAWELKSRWKGKKPILCDLSLSCGIHLNHKRIVDLGNLIGTIEDALQDAGIIGNDYQIKKYEQCEIYQYKTNHIEISLKAL